MKKYLARLSRRERILASAVALVLVVLLNIFFASFFLKRSTALRVQLASKKDSLQSTQSLIADRDLWTQRDAWIQERQPALENESTAGVQMLDHVRQVAKTNDVLLENPSFPASEKSAFHHSIPVALETKSSWQNLIRFLHAMQQPQEFVVFETAYIQIEPSDPSLLHGRFKIARWVKP
jgi:hypothetical protein